MSGAGASSASTPAPSAPPSAQGSPALAPAAPAAPAATGSSGDAAPLRRFRLVSATTPAAAEPSQPSQPSAGRVLNPGLQPQAPSPAQSSQSNALSSGTSLGGASLGSDESGAAPAGGALSALARLRATMAASQNTNPSSAGAGASAGASSAASPEGPATPAKPAVPTTSNAPSPAAALSAAPSAAASPAVLRLTPAAATTAASAPAAASPAATVTPVRTPARSPNSLAAPAAAAVSARPSPSPSPSPAPTQSPGPGPAPAPSAPGALTAVAWPALLAEWTHEVIAHALQVVTDTDARSNARAALLSGTGAAQTALLAAAHGALPVVPGGLPLAAPISVAAAVSGAAAAGGGNSGSSGPAPVVAMDLNQLMQRTGYVYLPVLSKFLVAEFRLQRALQKQKRAGAGADAAAAAPGASRRPLLSLEHVTAALHEVASLATTDPAEAALAVYYEHLERNKQLAAAAAALPGAAAATESGRARSESTAGAGALRRLRHVQSQGLVEATLVHTAYFNFTGVAPRVQSDLLERLRQHKEQQQQQKPAGSPSSALQPPVLRSRSSGAGSVDPTAAPLVVGATASWVTVMQPPSTGPAPAPVAVPLPSAGHARPRLPYALYTNAALGPQSKLTIIDLLAGAYRRTLALAALVAASADAPAPPAAAAWAGAAAAWGPEPLPLEAITGDALFYALVAGESPGGAVAAVSAGASASASVNETTLSASPVSPAASGASSGSGTTTAAGAAAAKARKSAAARRFARSMTGNDSDSDDGADGLQRRAPSAAASALSATGSAANAPVAVPAVYIAPATGAATAGSVGGAAVDELPVWPAPALVPDLPSVRVPAPAALPAFDAMRLVLRGAHPGQAAQTGAGAAYPDAATAARECGRVLGALGAALAAFAARCLLEHSHQALVAAHAHSSGAAQRPAEHVPPRFASFLAALAAPLTPAGAPWPATVACSGSRLALRHAGHLATPARAAEVLLGRMRDWERVTAVGAPFASGAHIGPAHASAVGAVVGPDEARDALLPALATAVDTAPALAQMVFEDSELASASLANPFAPAAPPAASTPSATHMPPPAALLAAPVRPVPVEGSATIAVTVVPTATPLSPSWVLPTVRFLSHPRVEPLGAALGFVEAVLMALQRTAVPTAEQAAAEAEAAMEGTVVRHKSRSGKLVPAPAATAPVSAAVASAAEETSVALGCVVYPLVSCLGLTLAAQVSDAEVMRGLGAPVSPLTGLAGLAPSSRRPLSLPGTMPFVRVLTRLLSLPGVAPLVLAHPAFAPMAPALALPDAAAVGHTMQLEALRAHLATLYLSRAAAALPAPVSTETPALPAPATASEAKAGSSAGDSAAPGQQSQVARLVSALMPRALYSKLTLASLSLALPALNLHAPLVQPGGARQLSVPVSLAALDDAADAPPAPAAAGALVPAEPPVSSWSQLSKRVFARLGQSVSDLNFSLSSLSLPQLRLGAVALPTLPSLSLASLNFPKLALARTLAALQEEPAAVLPYPHRGSAAMGTGRAFALASLLSALLIVQPTPSDPAFANLRGRDMREVVTTFDRYRASFHAVHAAVAAMLKRAMQTQNRGARRRVLDWCAQFLFTAKPHAALQGDTSAAPSAHTVLNLASVLLAVTEPALGAPALPTRPGPDGSFAWPASVDPAYFLRADEVPAPGADPAVSAAVAAAHAQEIIDAAAWRVKARAEAVAAAVAARAPGPEEKAVCCEDGAAAAAAAASELGLGADRYSADEMAELESLASLDTDEGDALDRSTDLDSEIDGEDEEGEAEGEDDGYDVDGSYPLPPSLPLPSSEAVQRLLGSVTSALTVATAAISRSLASGDDDEPVAVAHSDYVRAGAAAGDAAALAAQGVFSRGSEGAPDGAAGAAGAGGLLGAALRNLPGVAAGPSVSYAVTAPSGRGVVSLPGGLPARSSMPTLPELLARPSRDLVTVPALPAPGAVVAAPAALAYTAMSAAEGPFAPPPCTLSAARASLEVSPWARPTERAVLSASRTRRARLALRTELKRAAGTGSASGSGSSAAAAAGVPGAPGSPVGGPASVPASATLTALRLGGPATAPEDEAADALPGSTTLGALAYPLPRYALTGSRHVCYLRQQRLFCTQADLAPMQEQLAHQTRLAAEAYASSAMAAAAEARAAEERFSREAAAFLAEGAAAGAAAPVAPTMPTLAEPPTGIPEFSLRTELVALSLEALHLSLVPMLRGGDMSLRQLQNAERTVTQIRQEMAHLRELGPAEVLARGAALLQNEYAPAEARTHAVQQRIELLERELRRQEREVDMLTRAFGVRKMALFDPLLVRRALALYNWALGWVLACADSEVPCAPAPGGAKVSPLAALAAVPDYVVDDCFALVTLLKRYQDSTLTGVINDGGLDNVLVFCIRFSGLLTSPSFAAFVGHVGFAPIGAGAAAAAYAKAAAAASGASTCASGSTVATSSAADAALAARIPSAVVRAAIAGDGGATLVQRHFELRKNLQQQIGSLIEALVPQLPAERGAEEDQELIRADIDPDRHPFFIVPEARSYLVPLLLFLCDRAETGSRTAFYDKYTFRFTATRVLSAILDRGLVGIAARAGAVPRGRAIPYSHRMTPVDPTRAAASNIAGADAADSSKSDRFLGLSAFVDDDKEDSAAQALNPFVWSFKRVAAASSRAISYSRLAAIAERVAESGGRAPEVPIEFPLFDKFVHVLFNDIHYLLDEALQVLAKIKVLQDAELRGVPVRRRGDSQRARRRLLRLDAAAGGADDDAANNDGNDEPEDGGAAEGAPEDSGDTEESSLADLERHAGALNVFGLAAVRLVAMVAASAPRALLRRDFVGRVGIVVGVYVDKLVGKQVSELHVADPKKYYFKPGTLLAQMVTIFLTLGAVAPLARAPAAPPATGVSAAVRELVEEEEAEDMTLRGGAAFLESFLQAETKFSAPVMLRAAQILVSRGRLPQGPMAAPAPSADGRVLTLGVRGGAGEVARAVDYIERFCAGAAERERVLDEAPDEFRDICFYEVMTHPVKLPSGTVLDFWLLKRHLMTNPTDPFTRVPLTLDKIVPQLAFKKEIEQWKKDKGIDRQ